MNVPVIIWSLIVALFVSVLVFRLIVHLRNSRSVASHTSHLRHHALKHHLITIGTEREELFMPGDPTGHENYPPYARSAKPDYDDDII